MNSPIISHMDDFSPTFCPPSQLPSNQLFNQVIFSNLLGWYRFRSFLVHVSPRRSWQVILGLKSCLGRDMWNTSKDLRSLRAALFNNQWECEKKMRWVKQYGYPVRYPYDIRYVRNVQYIDMYRYVWIICNNIWWYMQHMLCVCVCRSSSLYYIVDMHH